MCLDVPPWEPTGHKTSIRQRPSGQSPDASLATVGLSSSYARRLPRGRGRTCPECVDGQACGDRTMDKRYAKPALILRASRAEDREKVAAASMQTGMEFSEDGDLLLAAARSGW